MDSEQYWNTFQTINNNNGFDSKSNIADPFNYQKLIPKLAEC